MKMKLFISYAHVDKSIVTDWIVNKLDAGGHDVWFDHRLIAGQSWKKQLKESIKECDALVYCMTPESVASEWCQWELAQAVEHHKPVIPVLMQAQTQLPDQLKQLEYVDFSDGATGDAVAKLMGGVHHLSPAQIPPAPADPKGKPAQAIEQNGKTGMKHKGAYIAVAFALLAAIVTVFGLWNGVLSNPDLSSDPTPDVAQSLISTPSTPRITAQQNMDIRNGPGTNFDRIAVLNAGEYLDILGISEDYRWYQVLLSDGNTGWVVNASSAGEVAGSLGALAVIVPTNTPTPTNLPTYTPTLLSIETNTPTSIWTEESVTAPIVTSSAETNAIPELTSTSTAVPQWFALCQDLKSQTTAAERPTLDGNLGEWTTWINLQPENISSCGKFSIYDDEQTNTTYAAIQVCDDDLYSPPADTDLNARSVNDMAFDVLEIDISTATPLVMVAPNATNSLPNRVTIQTSIQQPDCLILELSYRQIPDNSSFEITFYDVDASGEITTLSLTQPVQE